MRRLFFFSMLGLLALVAWAGLSGGRAGTASARDGAGSRGLAATTPLTTTCDFTVLNLNLVGAGTVESMRPFTPTAGDTFMQFIAASPPVTATGTSTGEIIVDHSFSGAVSGGGNGTFSLSNLDGIIVTNSTASASARGFELNKLVISTTNGTMTALVAIDYYSTSSTAPYYPRFFAGYLHTISATGSYAPAFTGYVLGSMTTIVGNTLALTASIAGRVYSGGDPMNEFVAATRSAPANRTTLFDPTDVFAQFAHPDFQVGAVAPGHLDVRSTFTGTTIGTINGGFLMDHESLMVDSGPNSGKGWLVGQFNFVDTGGDLLTGPWLSDRSGNSLSGYMFQGAGTGVYTDSIIFAPVTASFVGSNLVGTISNGTYCPGSQILIPTSTPTETPAPGTPTDTAIVLATSTPEVTTTSAASATSIAQATNTAQPAATASATYTSAPPPTGTATSTGVPSATATSCPIQFIDVPPGSTFYDYVRCLACRGIISGYPDGTFRPNNPVTRGQLAKIVSNSAGYNEAFSTNTFEDVPAGSAFFPYVERLYLHGAIQGYACGGAGEPCVPPDNKPYFRPNANVSRGQTSKIVAVARQLAPPNPGQQTFEDVPEGSPFWTWIEALAGTGAIQGYVCGGTGEPCVPPDNKPYFRPNANVSRGQSAKIVTNTFFPACVTPSR